MWRADSFEKTLMLGKIEGMRRRGLTGWDGWMASPTQWTWVWVNSRSWRWIGRPGVLWLMGLQRVGYDWATELNWTAPWKKGYDKPGQHIKKQRPHFANRGPYSKSYGFSSNCVCFWELLDHKGGWACPTLCDPMDQSMLGLPAHHQLLELTQTHVHWVGDAIQPSHPLSSPCPPAFNLSQHQGLIKWVSSLHQVAKVLEFQLQHQSFQWIFRTDFP